MSLETPAGRVMSRVTLNPETGCWICSYAKQASGYPLVTAQRDPEGKKKQKRADAVIFRFNGGCIPDGMTLRHTCGALTCVNPKHMRVVKQPRYVPPAQTFTAEQVRAKIKAIEDEYRAAHT